VLVNLKAYEVAVCVDTGYCGRAAAPEGVDSEVFFCD